MVKVIKRDGKEAEFNPEKIKAALQKANKDSEMTEADIDNILNNIVNFCQKQNEPIGVEVIQDNIEQTLMKKKFFATAKNFILYRDMRTRVRESKTNLFKEIIKKIEAKDVVNQNANVDERSFGGRKGEAANELMKWLALNNCMSKMARENHLNNEIYIHRQNCGI